jgi:hypothetical protein
LGCSFVLARSLNERVVAARCDEADEKDTHDSFVLFVPLSFIPFGRGQLSICLIALTIMTQIAKTEKPTGVFWYAFLAEKCILHHFFGLPKKFSLQLARHEAFTQSSKTGHVYDRGDFASGTASDNFLHNLLKINGMERKSARTEGCQNRVTYNNMPCAKSKKRTFLGGWGRTSIFDVTVHFKTSE